MQLRSKDLLGIEELTREEIELILETARSFQEVAGREIKKVPSLRGKTVANLFFEDSTRTRISFEIAAKRLSADLLTITKGGSSATKGETLLDTAKNLEALGAHIIVCRHFASGVPYWLSRSLKASIINAGDGSHEHPSQALQDVLTVLDIKKNISGLNVVLVGDIAHSRVARSNIFAFTKLNASLRVVGPATMIPREIEKLGVSVYYDLKEGIKGADVIMMLRIQKERIAQTPFSSLREYSKLYGLNREIMKGATSDVIIMHPGPVNRGIEMEPEIADGPHSVILNQVSNGVAVRMAIMYLLSGNKR